MFLFLLASLACFRLTRLITDDKIMDWLREAVIRNAPKPAKTKAKQGITCPFCVSFYWAVAIAWYIAFLGFIPWYMYPIWMPAIWAGSVLLNQVFVTLSK